MFDTTQDIKINYPLPTGKVEVVVSFPSDEQWCARQAKMKLKSQNLGRGKSTTEVSGTERVNAELFDQIVKSEVPGLDEYDKSVVIERLSRSSVSDGFNNGNGYEVKLKVPGGEVTHVLNMPTAKQVNLYRRAAIRVVDGRRGAQEIVINLNASGDLYDKLVVSATGYVGEVPIIHKSTVISEVLTMLEDDNGAEEIENF